MNNSCRSQPDGDEDGYQLGKSENRGKIAQKVEVKHNHFSVLFR